MRRFIAALSSATLLASLLVAAAVPSVGADTCLPTGYGTMTAAVINPAGPVGGDIDATGCNIGVFYDTGSGLVQGADIHGASNFGVLVVGDVNNVAVDVLDSSIHDIGSVGVYYRALGTGTATGTVAGNQIADYFKGGVTANGPGASVSITDNTVTGSGPVDYVAQNGIQLGWGAAGEVKRNTVTGNWYTGADWASTGILLFQTNDVTVQANSVDESQVGVGIESWCWLPPSGSASENKVVANTIANAQIGVSVGAVAWDGYSTCDPAASNNKVVNNTITAIPSVGYVGVWVWTYNGSASFTPTAINNKVTRNAISGYAYAIFYEDGSATKIHANVVAP